MDLLVEKPPPPILEREELYEGGGGGGMYSLWLFRLLNSTFATIEPAM